MRDVITVAPIRENVVHPTERVQHYERYLNTQHTVGPIPSRWSWVGAVKKTKILGLKFIQLLRLDVVEKLGIWSW